MKRRLAWALGLSCLAASFLAAACGDEESPEGATPGTGADASATNEGGAEGDASSTADAKPLPEASADAATPDACSGGDAGIGAACTKDLDCTCGNVCAGTGCVRKAACDEAVLSWDGPTTYADGRCVETLAGFKLYGSRDGGADAADAATSLVNDVGNPCVPGVLVACGDAGKMVAMPSCSARVGALVDGTWTFTVTAYDDAGVESPPSVSATKIIDCP